MTLSYEAQIADAVAGEINDPARPWNTPTVQVANAARGWTPWYQAEDLASLQVAVVPVMIPRQEALSRGRRVWEYDVAIDFQKQVDPGDRAGMDAINYLTQQVNDYWVEGRRLVAMPAWEVVRVKREAVYDLDMLYTEHTWETLIVATFRGDR